MPINLLFDLANYTPADASPVQSNLQQIEQYLNQEVITRDGLVAMTDALRLANSTPLNDLDAASKGYVDGLRRSAYIAAAEVLNVGGPADLTTVGPSVTMETGSLVRVTLFCGGQGATTTAGGMGFLVSGATGYAYNARPPTILFEGGISSGQQWESTTAVIPVVAGTNTFKAQYAKFGPDPYTFRDRIIVVERID